MEKEQRMKECLARFCYSQEYERLSELEQNRVTALIDEMISQMNTNDNKTSLDKVVEKLGTEREYYEVEMEENEERFTEIVEELRRYSNEIKTETSILENIKHDIRQERLKLEDAVAYLDDKINKMVNEF
ncbi:hypothetical protein [Staphylococcus sp. GDY8P126P]|uniref:hypothetical protein n=1 Tax=Staphylococcus TaxID=1279 RepID=UPI001AEBDF56|nr:hypothetical protein [Staphylococcus sp. GDY8P126P]